MSPAAGNDLRDAVRAGRSDPVGLVERALARIAERDGEIGAFVHVDAAGALAQARALARQREPYGPLHGVPVGVKDLFDVAGQVTRAGSAVPAGPPAVRDADAVARLRAAGAVIIGRTRTHEFAWGITTQHASLGGTANPWDPTRVPGGSSGGSAAAVAAGLVPLALGTDTGCSIRLPAAWCGLVGHKPTYGAVSLSGCTPLAPSLDHGGALVRTVADARLALGVLGVRLPPPQPVGRLRVGVVTASTTPGVGRALAKAYARSPVPVREVELPTPDRWLPAYLGVQSAQALQWHRATGRWPQHAAAYGPDVRGHLEQTDAAGPDRAAAAQASLWQLRASMAGLLEQVDVLLLPVATCGPSLRSSPDQGPQGPLRDALLPWTVPANLCGLPACSVPAGLDDDGLPVGVQVVGRAGQDGQVLDLAAAITGS